MPRKPLRPASRHPIINLHYISDLEQVHASQAASSHYSAMDNTFANIQWDVSTGRPIIDGKTVNALTGEVQEPGQSRTSGPPSVDVIWHNLNTNSSFRTVRSSCDTTIDRLFVVIGRQVEAQRYRLVSVNVTTYSFTIFCASDLTKDEFHTLWSEMKLSL